MAAPQRTKSRWQTLNHKAKVAGLTAQRWFSWMAQASEFPPSVLAGPIDEYPTVAWRRTLPMVRHDAQAQPLFEAGKRHNLQLAKPAFDGLLLQPGRIFSFWRTLGEASLERGFRYGMELLGGCVVPAVGGGICLLSNALFAMAVELDFRIVERHGHSISAVPLQSGEAWGLDATVFYPYIDLRVIAPLPIRLGLTVTSESLILEARSTKPLPVRVEIKAIDERHEQQGSEEFRRNRLVRRRFIGDTFLSEETIAENRKRLLSSDELGRSCLTCGDQACHTRPKELSSLIAHNDRDRRT